MAVNVFFFNQLKVLKAIPTRLFVCVVIVIVVLWTLLSFLNLVHFLNHVTVFGVNNRPLLWKAVFSHISFQFKGTESDWLRSAVQIM